MTTETVDRVAVQAAVFKALRDVAGVDVVWPGTTVRELGLGPGTLAKVARLLERDLSRHIDPASLAGGRTAQGLVDAVMADEHDTVAV